MPDTVPDTPENTADFALRELRRRVGTLPKVETARELYRRDLPPLEYLVRDMITEGAHLLGGRPKTGKSWLVLQLGLAVAQDEPFLGRPTKGGDVLYLALEDSDRRMRQRIARLLPDLEGAWPERFHYATWWHRIDKGGLEALQLWLHEHGEAALVIIDTLAKVRPRRRPSEQIYDTDYAVGEAVKQTSARFPGVTFIAVTHTRKQDAADALDTISGSTGLTGSFDGAIVLQRERGKDEAVLSVISRDLEGETEWGIAWDTNLTQWRLVGTAAEVQATEQQRRVIALLRAAEADMAPVTIAAELGMQRAAVRQLLKRMREAGLVLRTGKAPRYVYTLSSPSSHHTHTSHASQTSQGRKEDL